MEATPPESNGPELRTQFWPPVSRDSISGACPRNRLMLRQTLREEGRKGRLLVTFQR